MAATKRLLGLLLLLAVAAPRSLARHMTPSALSLGGNDVDNNISTSTGDASGYAADKPTSWVRITVAPSPSVRHARDTPMELECEAVGSPAPIVRWVKDGKPLSELDAYDTNMVDETAGRGLAKVRARLVVRRLLEGNAGVYTCVAQAGRHVATARSEVYVLAGHEESRLKHLFMTKTSPPRIVLYDTVYMDHMGEDVILPCSVVGSPLPEVLWLDPEENPLSEDKRFTVLPNGALLIRSIRWNDMGPYTCIARNNHGQDNITTFLYPMLAEK